MTTRMVLLLFFFVVQTAGMDAHVEEEKLSIKKVLVTNSSAYPEIVLVCCTYSFSEAQCHKVQDNEEVGSSGDEWLHFFAFPKELLEAHGGVWATNSHEASLVSTELDFLYLAGKVDGLIVRGEEIPYDMPMASDTLYYELTGVNDVNVTLRLKKRVITFSDGTPERTIEYSIWSLRV